MLTDCLHLILIAKSDTIFQRNHVSLIAAKKFDITIDDASIDSDQLWANQDRLSPLDESFNQDGAPGRNLGGRRPFP